MKKLIIFISFVCMFLFAGCSKTEEDTTIIRVAFNQAENHPEYLAIKEFGEKFSEATNGRYEVQIYPNAVLGDQGAVTEMVRTGALQMAIVPVSVPEGYNGDFAIVSAPYLYDDLEQLKTAAREGVFDTLFATTRKYGFEISALYTSGARHIYTDKPIVTPEDLAGYKIRVQDSDAYIHMINCMGGVGIPMAQSEVYAATQQKVIEGGENSEVVYLNFKHYEVSPYFCYTNHLIMVDVLATNPDFLASMDAETREIFDRLIRDSMETEFSEWDNAVAEAKELLQNQGITFVESDTDAFRRTCQSLLDSIAFRSETTKDIYDRIMEIKGRPEAVQMLSELQNGGNQEDLG